MCKQGRLILLLLQVERALTYEKVHQAFEEVDIDQLIGLVVLLTSDQNLANVNETLINRIKELAKTESFPFTLAPMKEQLKVYHGDAIESDNEGYSDNEYEHP